MSDRKGPVLLVEDEALIRLMLAAEFEDAGFQVHEAGSADEAIDLLSAGLAVRSVVTDVRMPGRLDGIGLTAWLADHQPAMPVIITSGYVTASEVAQVSKAIVAVVTKPYNPADVVALVVDGAPLGRTR